MFSSLLNPLLVPLLHKLGVFWFVMFISFFITLLTTVVYKYTTDQILMKNLREQIDKLRAQMKQHQKDPKKMMAINKEMLDKQIVMMKHSFSSTLITMLPLIILIGWLSGHLAYEPLQEDVQFTLTVNFEDYVGNVTLIVPKEVALIDDATKQIQQATTWRLSGEKGEHLLEFVVGGKTYQKDVLISEEQEYAEQSKRINDGIVKSIDINYKKKIVMDLFGWELGWLGSYFLTAIAFSIVIRKLLKVY